jgi:hypothetical protein
MAPILDVDRTLRDEGRAHVTAARRTAPGASTSIFGDAGGRQQFVRFRGYSLEQGVGTVLAFVARLCAVLI